MTWLARTPIGVVRACLAKLSGLQAEERLEGLAVATTAGAEDGLERQRTIRRWNEEAYGRDVERASPEALAEVGVKVVSG